MSVQLYWYISYIYFFSYFYQRLLQNTSWCLLFCVTSSFCQNLDLFLESRLFFKQPTSWRPHISRDVLISVASEMSKQTLVSNGRVPQLPVQVLGYIIYAHMFIYLIICWCDLVWCVRHDKHTISNLICFRIGKVWPVNILHHAPKF